MNHWSKVSLLVDNQSLPQSTDIRHRVMSQLKVDPSALGVASCYRKLLEL